MKNINGKFNKAVFWPEEVEDIVKKDMGHPYSVKSTMHFAQRASELGLSLGCFKSSLFGDIIEAEIFDGKTEKIITRITDPTDNKIDLCFAIALNAGNASVKTVWVNKHNDNHATIRAENYTRSL